MKRFIVLLEKATDAQNQKFLAYLKKEGLGWWHWFDNSWLITGSNTNLTAADIRTQLQFCFTGVNNLVIELNDTGDTWAGFGPSTIKKDMFAWVKQNWIKSNVKK